MKKIRKNITLPEDVDRDFKDIVARLEPPFKKGAYGKWLARALRDFIYSHSKQQQSAKNLQFSQPAVNEIRKNRELMQMIVKTLSWDKGIEINRGTALPVIDIRKAITNIRNLDPRDPRTVTKWINRLLEHEFIRKKNYNMFEVLDTGQNWDELEPTNSEISEETQHQCDIVKEELR